MMKFTPHRFHCVTCGCSLYYLDDLNRNECSDCLAWLGRIVHRYLVACKH